MKIKKYLIISSLLIVGCLIVGPIGSATTITDGVSIKITWPVEKKPDIQMPELDTEFILNTIEDLAYFTNNENYFGKDYTFYGRTYGSSAEKACGEEIFSIMNNLNKENNNIFDVVTKERIINCDNNYAFDYRFDTDTLTKKLDVVASDLKLTNTKTGDSFTVEPTEYYISPNCDIKNNVVLSYHGLKIINVTGYFYNISDFSLNWDAIDAWAKNEDYLLLMRNSHNYPLYDLNSLGPFIQNLYNKGNQYGLLWMWDDDIKIRTFIERYSKTESHCKGFIIYDFLPNLHDMVYSPIYDLPVIYINGTLGKELENSITGNGKLLFDHGQRYSDYTVDLKFAQRYDDVESYNVYCQINGTNPNDVDIISGLYDGQNGICVADSLPGQAVVLALAKYYAEYYSRTRTKPDATLRFCAFAGEEYGYRGAIYHANAHYKENIKYVFDINQIGMKQTFDDLEQVDGFKEFNFGKEGRDRALLSLNLISNNIGLLEKAWGIAKTHDYYKQVVGNDPDNPQINDVDGDEDGSPDGMEKLLVDPFEFNMKKVVSNLLSGEYTFAPLGFGAPSNDRPFAMRVGTKTLCFLKDTANHAWIYHHRAGGAMRGMGDNLEHIDTKDIEVTAKIILHIVDNIIKENDLQIGVPLETLDETDPQPSILNIINANSNNFNNNFLLFILKSISTDIDIKTANLSTKQTTSYPITKTAENTATTSANDISLSSTSKTSTDTPTYPTDTISALNNQESAPATTKDVTSETAASETISSILHIQPINTIQTSSPTTPTQVYTNIPTTSESSTPSSNKISSVSPTTSIARSSVPLTSTALATN